MNFKTGAALIGTLVTISVAILGFFSSRITTIEQTVASKSEKLAGVEVQVNGIDNRLNRIEGKIDQLITKIR